MTDPWAAASGGNAGAATAATAAQGAQTGGNGHQDGGQGTQQYTSVAANPVQNAANPFLTAEQAAPRMEYDPFVPYAELLGRMIVMVPKRFTDQDPKPEQFGGKPGEVRDKWTVEIVVLDGGPLEFTYQHRESRDAEPVEKTMKVTELPHTFRGQSIFSGQLIRALNGANDSGAFLYGVWTRVPVAQDARAGKTIESLAAEIQKWQQAAAAGRPVGNMPRHTYNLDSRPAALTQARMNLALAWWEQEKANRLATAS